jgi:hypothetical protein
MLAAGSVLLIQAYVGLSRRITRGWLASPLGEIAARRKLLYGLHILFFGLVVIAAVLIYELPLVQSALMSALQRQIESGKGVLGVAGTAYKSKNIALAAGATVGINFLLGSLVVITLPSLVLPGVGLLLALFRAALWGILLAPATVVLALTWMPHSGTMLLEGEGYILATFFAVLTAIYLFSPKVGPTAASRYGRALVMNLKGNLLVLIVLAVAAFYEATEVILMMGLR